MTDESPAALLGEVEKLRRLTRARVHGAALPLAVFGLLTLASAVLYKTPFVRVFRGGDDINHLSNGPICLEGCDSVHSIGYDVSGYAGLYWSDRSAALSIAFWLIVAPLCYAGCAWWYRRRAERTGLMMRWQSWAYVGVALMALIIVTLVVRAQAIGSLGVSEGDFQPEWAVNPLLAICLGLLILARVERSPGTAAIALCYGTLVFLLSSFPLYRPVPILGNDALKSPGPGLVVLASLLLIGAAAMWLRTRAQRRRA